MSDLEYPRWVHAPGLKSIVAETPEDEAAFLASALPANASAPVAAPAPPAALTTPLRYRLSLDADPTVAKISPDPLGSWVHWNDVAALFGGNLLVDESAPPALPEAADAAPKRTGGWPKGKPRAPRQASVN